MPSSAPATLPAPGAPVSYPDGAPAVSPRRHPQLSELFRQAESRHFDDEELAAVTALYPELEPAADAARATRDRDIAVIGRVVREVYGQYPYEKHHEYSTPKCVRDVRYVIAYACHAMVANDPKWFEDKLLFWLKTILQAFGFPAREKSAAGALFADKTLEGDLKGLPEKCQSIYHCYYRLKQELGRELSPAQFALLSPYLDQALAILPAPPPGFVAGKTR